MTGMGKVGSAHSLKPAVKSTNGFHDKADEESGHCLHLGIGMQTNNDLQKAFVGVPYMHLAALQVLAPGRRYASGGDPLIFLVASTCLSRGLALIGNWQSPLNGVPVPTSPSYFRCHYLTIGRQYRRGSARNGGWNQKHSRRFERPGGICSAY